MFSFFSKEILEFPVEIHSRESFRDISKPTYMPSHATNMKDLVKIISSLINVITENINRISCFDH